MYRLYHLAFRDQIAREKVSRHVQPLLDLLNKAIDEKLIRPFDVDLLFSLFSGQVFSVSNYLLSAKLSAKKIDKLVEEALAFWDDG